MDRLSNNAISIINALHTERLDYESEYLPLIDAVNLLAAYEDTGLSPEDIQEAVNLFADLKDADIPKELKSWVERCAWHVRKCEELRKELEEHRCKVKNTLDSEIDYVEFELAEIKARQELQVNRFKEWIAAGDGQRIATIPNDSLFSYIKSDEITKANLLERKRYLVTLTQKLK